MLQVDDTSHPTIKKRVDDPDDKASSLTAPPGQAEIGLRLISLWSPFFPVGRLCDHELRDSEAEDLSGFGKVTRNLKEMLQKLRRLGRLSRRELYGKKRWSERFSNQRYLRGKP